MLELALADAGRKQEIAERIRHHMTVPANQQILQHCRLFKQLDILEGPADARMDDAMRRQLEQVVLTVVNRARRRLVEPADQVENRALAGTVRTDDREYLTGLYLERYVFNRMHAAEFDRQVADRQRPGPTHRRRAVFR